MNLRTILAGMFALLVAACNPVAQIGGADERIEEFHETYNRGDARALYGRTAPEFREITSAGEMETLVAAVTERLGKVKSSEREGLNLNSDDGTTQTVVTMRTEFENGDATETFYFVGHGENMALAGWNVEVIEPDPVPDEAVTEVDANGEVAADPVAID